LAKFGSGCETNIFLIFNLLTFINFYLSILSTLPPRFWKLKSKEIRKTIARLLTINRINKPIGNFDKTKSPKNTFEKSKVSIEKK